MPTSKITVYKNQKPASGIKVTLEFSGIANVGFTKPVYTDSNGVALVEHASTGKANVYINGSRKGSIHAPNQDIYYL